MGRKQLLGVLWHPESLVRETGFETFWWTSDLLQTNGLAFAL
jgi:hypothetical protein